MCLCLVLPISIGFSGCTQKMCSTPEKIADYLYEISYSDYRKDTNFETINGASEYGCSSVRNGNFYGRNFDYVFNETPEFVVRVSATKNRHASVGIATHFGLQENKMDTYEKELELIPNFTLDGINDAGVICSHNVVKIEDGNVITGTNPNGEDLHMLFIPRFVLDNASSADEAIKLIKSRNIIGNFKNENYLHIMIADKNKTYIVEFYKDGVIIEEKQGDKQIMTNYYLNLPVINENAQGVERYKILQDNYSEGKTFEGMRALMQRVQYSKAYIAENKWYSEILTQTEINSPDRDALFSSRGGPLASQYRYAIDNDIRNPANPSFWITVHNSTYDMDNRKLSVIVQEDYAHHYDFEL